MCLVEAQLPMTEWGAGFSGAGELQRLRLCRLHFVFLETEHHSQSQIKSEKLSIPLRRGLE
jgi:hypothetical protein